MNKTLPMSRKNTMDIMYRMDCFCDLLGAICRGMEEEEPIVGVIHSAKDLITCICRDFQADIDCAELELEKGDVL